MSPLVAHTSAGLSFMQLKRLAAHCLIAVLAAGCAATAPRAQSEADAPGRVGRISLLSGPVTLSDSRSGEAEAASLNWPITSAHRLTTGNLGRAEVRIGSFAVRLDGDSDVDFTRIDDSVIQLTVIRGSVAVRARNRELLREFDLITPRERIALDDVGRYRIDVDQVHGVTSVTTLVGAARITTNTRMSVTVQSGQRGEIYNGGQTGFQLVTPAMDNFDDWVAARDRRDDVVHSTRHVSIETTGVESLDEYGDWRYVGTYGYVWFPSNVTIGWAPYRYGRWAWVAPWGWTWIDEAPWGFAPFHYGRWVFVGGGWGWIPGVVVPRPVYAPALVAWYGAPGVSVSVGIGAHVGWFPLGPGEIYVPGYYYSRRYINGVNYGHVTNITQITIINPPPRYRYQNPNYSTWSNRDIVVRQQPIHKTIVPAPQEWARIPTMPTPPVRVADGVSKRTLPVTNARPDWVRAPAAPVTQTRPFVPERSPADSGGNVHVRPAPGVIVGNEPAASSRSKFQPPQEKRPEQRHEQRQEQRPVYVPPQRSQSQEIVRPVMPPARQIEQAPQQAMPPMPPKRAYEPVPPGQVSNYPPQPRVQQPPQQMPPQQVAPPARVAPMPKERAPSNEGQQMVGPGGQGGGRSKFSAQ